ncbi:hypothetical protein [Yersinia ruckeri]|uniref:hypothetical protein n=1 Tax=Yersinia ruckeri TaxID=29486 RepID=UPI001F17244A|nr:hypothetical protein [Yersinia ruckeri]UIN02553.1 hypothetical protein LGL91_17955 [Yersinia ruckeri]
MSDTQWLNEQELMECKTCIRETINKFVMCGLINSRDDVIRMLIGGGFDILAYTDKGLTICAPDNPHETLILEGYVFSSNFKLSPAFETKGTGEIPS